jgi:prepilin-type N-terminal cleavage/methylation domain-containing protein
MNIVKNMNKKNKKIKDKGFTVIELLVVIVVIGILATIIITSLTRARLQAKNASIIMNMASLDSIIDADKYPGSFSDLCLEFESGGSFEIIRASIESNGGIWNCDSTDEAYRIFVKLNQDVVLANRTTHQAFAQEEDSSLHNFGNYYCLNSRFQKNFAHWDGDSLAFPSCSDEDYINTPVDVEDDPDPTPDPEPESDPEPPLENGGPSCDSPKKQVCHFEKTLCVSSKALKGHSKHGDVEGVCS